MVHHPAPEILGKWRISTTNDEGRFKNLDLHNDRSGDKTRVCLAEPGFYSGQFWTLIPYDDEEGVNGKGEGKGRWFKLSNDWTGPGWFLDRRRSGSCEAFMSQGNYSGQRWWITVPEMLESAAKGSLPKAMGKECYDPEALQHLERKQKSYVAVSLIGAAAVGFMFGRMWDLLF